MIQYLCIFALSAILLGCGNQSKSRRVRKLLFFCAILSISLFSALRGTKVGTDTASYLREFSRALRSHGNFRSLLIDQNIFRIETSFIILEYIFSFFKNGFPILLFTYSFLTHLFILLGIKNIQKANDTPPLILWLMYCTLFYNCTLNNIRQWLSIAIIFYAFSDEDSIRYKKTIALIILATVFHTSGLIGFLLLLFYMFNCRQKHREKIFDLIFGIGICFIPIFIPSIVSIFSRILNSSARYSYITRSVVQSVADMDKLTFIIRMVFAICYLISFTNLSRVRYLQNKDIFLLYIVLLDAFSALSYNQLNLRLNQYIAIFELSYATKGRKIFDVNKRSRFSSYILLLILLIVYWYIKYILWNNNVTHPFYFNWQDIPSSYSRIY